MDSPSRAVSSASKPRPRPRRAGVRVVAKIRPQTASEVTGPPQISILRPDGDHPSIVFADRESSRKDSYKMDWCYGQDEGVGEIFYREVNPLLRGVCHGSNACVISYGPRESGKTEMIQGSEENPGVAPMAVSEILSHAEELGGSVSVSCYEVCQDRVYDLLEPKEQEVLILEDAARKVQLKGLSLIPVKSISDFNKLYFHELDKRKQSDKRVSDVATRKHRGYRESKLTRLLQDFLCDGNAAVLITCLNSTLSQDTIHAVSLASRSCQATIQHLRDSAHSNIGTPKIVPSSSLVNSSPEKRIEVTPFVTMRRHQRQRNSVQKPVISLSRLNDKKTNRTPSTTKGRQPLQNSVQKITATLSRLNDKKASHSPSVMEGRKLFNVANPISRSVQDIFSPNATTAMNTPKRENPLLRCNSVASTMTQEDHRASYVAKSVESSASEADDSSLQLVSLSIPQVDVLCSRHLDTHRVDPKTPDVSGQAKVYYNSAFEDTSTPQEIFGVRSTGLKKTLVQV